MVEMLKFEIFGTQKVLKLVTQATKMGLQITCKFIIFNWKF